ncbi:MAG TPA: hypothetical protein VMH49_05075 [Thermoplasmata archaeon]|nr:hypothetical protein [Thermoplasmata archaeon]
MPPPSRRRTPRTPSRRATAAAPVPSAAPAPVPAPRRRLPAEELTEEPHAHIVCRVCGRIQGLELTELDRHLLTELAGLTPDGWSVERIAYSVAGACRRCREGPSIR